MNANKLLVFMNMAFVWRLKNVQIIKLNEILFIFNLNFTRKNQYISIKYVNENKSIIIANAILISL